jgi:hypothetical protein
VILNDRNSFTFGNKNSVSDIVFAKDKRITLNEAKFEMKTKFWRLKKIVSLSSSPSDYC